MQLQHSDVSNHISDLPHLLDQKLEDILASLLLDTVIRGETKRNFISDIISSMKQPPPNFPATPMSLDESNKIRHVPSGDSWTDSGYGTNTSRQRCGNSDCMGNCHICTYLASPLSNKSQSDFLNSSPSYKDGGNGFIDPALLCTSASTGILQPTEQMDELLELQFPPKPYVGNPFLDDCGA